MMKGFKSKLIIMAVLICAVILGCPQPATWVTFVIDGKESKRPSWWLVEKKVKVRVLGYSMLSPSCSWYGINYTVIFKCSDDAAPLILNTDAVEMYFNDRKMDVGLRDRQAHAIDTMESGEVRASLGFHCDVSEGDISMNDDGSQRYPQLKVILDSLVTYGNESIVMDTLHAIVKEASQCDQPAEGW